MSTERYQVNTGTVLSLPILILLTYNGGRGEQVCHDLRDEFAKF